MTKKVYDWIIFFITLGLVSMTCGGVLYFLLRELLALWGDR